MLEVIGMKKKKLLMITHSAGFKHDYLPTAKKVITELGEKSGMFKVFATEDCKILTSKNLEQYFSIFFLFFIASLVYSLDILITGEGLPASIDGIVLEKLLETILVVVPILLILKFSGSELDSLYLKKGNLKLGLIIGVSVLLFFLITSVEVSMLLFGAQDVTAENVILWSPWIMIFAFSNGLKEELLYRGLFLRKYESYLGKDTANFLQALIFTLAHLGSQYTPELLIFAVITFFLGLGFGAVMQKTDSLLGSILSHAGADIPVVIAYFSVI